MRTRIKGFKDQEKGYTAYKLIEFLEYLEKEVKAGRLRPMTEEERVHDRLANPGHISPYREFNVPPPTRM